jgi:predicted permease
VVPLFAIVFLGFFAGRVKILSLEGIRDLTLFVFYFAIPPVLFRMMAQAPLSEISQWGGYFAAYAGAQALTFATVALPARFVLRRPFSETLVLGLGGMFGNTVFVTLPLVLTLYDEASAFPVLLLIILEGGMIFPFAIVVMELIRGRSAETGGIWSVLRSTLISIGKSPIILAQLAGIIFAIGDWQLPGLVNGTIELLGKAAAPCALFALGATLSQQRLRGEIEAIGLMVIAKLLLHPWLTLLMTAYVFKLDPHWVTIAVLCAAVPSGNIVYLLAHRYNAALAAAAAAILLSTGLALFTITGWLLVLPNP